ncbi:hypothetical protein F4561_003381 [Lipingzhangella halophila]|uniref:2-keto-4-pentenoate hydratase n=1 Tax=Lipingzhangella halophila TaxID=1783352 RepID=A0A7W7RJF5_9ACTN|nr:hypothetical protein [Lipingzhangella halophila]MBB4932561.1 hypothetical protein [Lipingzhangella halophila]
MRWVTYLSPSGGVARSGVIDDGCVFGYPGEQSVPELLAGGGDALAEAYQRALTNPVEIIVEFEARLCAPLRPAAPVPVLAHGEQLTVAPSQVWGTDDGATLPPGASGLAASVGVAAVLGGRGLYTGCTPACLWRAPDGTPVRLSLGPAVVTRDELAGSALTVTASVDDSVLASVTTEDDASWTEGLQGDVMARVSAPTRLLEPGEELFVDGGPLGEFEIRVGAGA